MVFLAHLINVYGPTIDPISPLLVIGLIVFVVRQLRKLGHVQLEPLSEVCDSSFPELTPLHVEQEFSHEPEQSSTRNALSFRIFSLAFILVFSVMWFQQHNGHKSSPTSTSFSYFPRYHYSFFGGWESSSTPTIRQGYPHRVFRY